MLLYGYSEGIQADSPLSLSEVTISTNANELREMAKFLNQVANKIEEFGRDFEHEHLSDYRETYTGADLIVFNEDAL
ncbi:Imm32 family immunity protein [Thaumasiovibrio subtropicus]|uniref:Imm32 family immunity protein n=1 Tax=Thaumasiovibrio subtropicus TaxID=1891207 RepID=UPI000B363550|nr:hypothetical protein [Thaumasiovibrio subtropicus]